MIHFGNKCVSFCESLDAMNDVHIIFLYQTFQLQSVFYGDQSKFGFVSWWRLTADEVPGFKTWRRLNDAISALLAAGLHENVQEGHNVPFFLVEVRKRIFARLYGIDISLATFLGRPPRMSKRFCCINFPLDLDPEAYCIGGEALDRELSNLDANGWNTQGHIRTSAVMRWSIVTAMIREDTLELLLGQNIPDMPQRLGYVICSYVEPTNKHSGLRRNINDAWNNLPRFLAVTSEELWSGRRLRQETESLHLIRLFYLQTVFLIEWAAWRHGVEQSHSLFRPASELLSWVNEALIRREQLPNLGFISLAWRVSISAISISSHTSLTRTGSILRPPSRWGSRPLPPPTRRKNVVQAPRRAIAPTDNGKHLRVDRTHRHPAQP